MMGATSPHVDETLLRPVAETVPLDWVGLALYLEGQGLAFDPTGEVRQFAGGYGNLNYLILVDGVPAVLRRPPFGDIPRGANDMGREFRVLSVLAPVWRLAPKPVVYCSDPAPIGAPFLISEFRSGLPLHGTAPLGARMTPERARDLSMLQVDILKELHGFDIDAIGAGALGRRDGFAARTLTGWSRRLEGARTAPPPDAARLVARLAGVVPEDGRLSVIHNDFKLDNVVVDPETLAPRAVLDWDMSTLGAPFFDLGTMLTYWAEVRDPDALRATNLTHSASKGAPSRRELAEAYVRATGFDSPTDECDMRFFLALSFAKLGVVYLQLYDRFTADPVGNARHQKFRAAAPAAFALGHDALDGQLI